MFHASRFTLHPSPNSKLKAKSSSPILVHIILFRDVGRTHVVRVDAFIQRLVAVVSLVIVDGFAWRTFLVPFCRSLFHFLLLPRNQSPVIGYRQLPQHYIFVVLPDHNRIWAKIADRAGKGL